MRSGKPRAEGDAGATYPAGASRAEQTPVSISDHGIIGDYHSVPGKDQRYSCPRALHSEQRYPVSASTCRGGPDLLAWRICSPKFAYIRPARIGRRMGIRSMVSPRVLKFIYNSAINGGIPSATSS